MTGEEGSARDSKDARPEVEVGRDNGVERSQEGRGLEDASLPTPRTRLTVNDCSADDSLLGPEFATEL